MTPQTGKTWHQMRKRDWFAIELRNRGLRHAVAALFYRCACQRHVASKAGGRWFDLYLAVSGTKPGVLWRFARVWKAVRP